jgi:LPS export ABC transporter protein LptC
MKRALFFVAFMTLGTAVLLKLLVTEPAAPDDFVLEEPQALNVLNMQDVVVHQLVGEGVHWELHARRAHFNEGTQAGLLEEVRFHVYEVQPNGLAPLTVLSGRSARAMLAGQRGVLVLQGGVRLWQGDDLDIRSERLEYDEQRQLLTSPGHVVVRSPQGVHEGASLHYWMAEERLEYTEPRFYQ